MKNGIQPSSLWLRPCASRNWREPFLSQMWTPLSLSSLALVEPLMNHKSSSATPLQNNFLVVSSGKTPAIIVRFSRNKTSKQLVPTIFQAESGLCAKNRKSAHASAVALLWSFLNDHFELLEVLQLIVRLTARMSNRRITTHLWRNWLQKLQNIAAGHLLYCAAASASVQNTAKLHTKWFIHRVPLPFIRWRTLSIMSTRGQWLPTLRV